MDLEALALSGVLFERPSSPPRAPSRSRSPSPDLLWLEDDSDSTAPTLDLNGNPQGKLQQAGSNRTGVKGVIRDHNEALNAQQARRTSGIKEMNRRMERMALTGRTFAEDEDARLLEQARLERQIAVQPTLRPFAHAGKFGQLREVGEAGFVSAIEDELSGTWVVLHIYDASLERCHEFDDALVQLARRHRQTKFLRARAGAVGFATQPLNAASRDNTLVAISEKDAYSDEDDGNLSEEEDNGPQVTDTDMLPTLLAYRAGQLVHTWVRADWEVETWAKRGGKNVTGLEALLHGHHIIQSSNCGVSSDDELVFAGADSAGEYDDDNVFDL